MSLRWVPAGRHLQQQAILLEQRRRRQLSTVVDLAHLSSPAAAAVDIDRLLSSSKEELLKSYRVTPPVHPWPNRLHPQRLVAMIRRQQDLDLAVRIFHHAGDFHPGFSHTYRTYHALIDKLSRARSFPQLELLLSHLRHRCRRSSSSSSFRCGEEAFIGVIRSYGLAGKPSAALRTFLSIRSDFGVNASVRSFNALLNAMIQNRRYDLVGVLFRNCSRKFGIAPNVFTCNILVKALCKMGNLDGALKVLEEMPLWGMIPNLVTFTTLVGGFCGRGDLEGARRIFSEMVDRGISPDATAFTVLMEGYCAENRIMEAVRIMDEMAENGVTAGEVTYSLIISALCNSGKPVEALNLLHDMLDGGHLPGAPLCCKLFDDLCHQGKVEDAYGAWKKLLKKNFAPDGTIASTLIHWLCKKGKLWEAEELLQLVEGGAPASLLPYNTIIAGMCELGELQEAGRLWDRMEGKGCFPNAFSYGVLIGGFCRAGKAREAVAVLREMVERGLVPDGATCSAIVDGLDDAADRDEVTQVLGQGRQSTAATSAASS
ncbi:unnamed protein product [Spirodela intermedia]|uniref:Uncharacterized protein n=1 Tax=Spirodela intermedia TaxID=51605 RepID=A0A7I8JVX2_SPIIN|nr:unnamed protein product [Spirodela intermedia]